MIRTGQALAAACVDVAKNYKTLYVAGAFGWPMTPAQKTRAKNAYSYNRRPERASKIDSAGDTVFVFDEVKLDSVLSVLKGYPVNVVAVLGSLFEFVFEWIVYKVFESQIAHFGARLKHKHIY